MPPSNDRLLRGIAVSAPYRVAVADTSNTVREALERHGAQNGAADALARGMTGLTLMTVMDKEWYRLSAQWLGRGPLGTLNVDLRAPGDVRAFATGADYVGPLDGALGAGVLSLMRQKEGGQFSQGQVPLASSDVDGDLEAYLDRSDQVPTVLRVMCSQWESGRPGRVQGVLVQAMPGATRGGLRDVVSDALLARTLGSDDLTALAALAVPALGEIEWLGDDPVRWACGCSEQRVFDGVRLLGAAEIDDMIAKQEQPEVRCDYCTRVYVVHTEALRSLRATFED